MRAPGVTRIRLLASLAVLIGAVGPVVAEDEPPETGWGGSAEMGAVITSGNAEAESFSARVQLTRRWQASTLSFEASGLRAESTTTTRFGVGSPESFELVEESITELTAENYLMRSRFDRSISERAFWFLGAEWDRNTFAGVDNRYIGTVGAGHHWIESETTNFSTTYGASYTRQENVVGGAETFFGVHLGYGFDRLLTPSTTFGSSLVADGNLDETSDYRFDSRNWIEVSMSERLALKVSLQALYDNQPSLTEVSLFDDQGTEIGETVLVPLDELDLLWTATLVVWF